MNINKINKIDMSKFLEKIIENVLYEIIAAAIISFIGTIIGISIANQYTFSNLEKVLIATLCFLIIGFVSFFLIRWLNKKLPKFSSVNSNFHMIKEEREHRWENENNYLHIRRYTLKALRQGLTEYRDKFLWTGTSYTLLGGNRNYSVEELSETDDVFNTYQFRFNRPLNKNEVITVEAKWNAIGPAKPFFSTTIEEPTDLLVMTVKLFSISNINEVNCCIEPCKAHKIPMNTIGSTEQLDSEGKYIWTIKKPKLLHHYKINWKRL